MGRPNASIYAVGYFIMARFAFNVSVCAYISLFGEPSFDTRFTALVLFLSRVACVGVFAATPAVITTSSLHWVAKCIWHASVIRSWSMTAFRLRIAGVDRLWAVRQVLFRKQAPDAGAASKLPHLRTRHGLALFIATHVAGVAVHALP